MYTWECACRARTRGVVGSTGRLQGAIDVIVEDTTGTSDGGDGGLGDGLVEIVPQLPFPDLARLGRLRGKKRTCVGGKGGAGRAVGKLGRVVRRLVGEAGKGVETWSDGRVVRWLGYRSSVGVGENLLLRGGFGEGEGEGKGRDKP